MPAPARYRCFTRTWWRPNPTWPDGREPGPGRKSYSRHPKNVTWEEAREYCRKFNETHDPGPLSYKAEFEEM
jgi:hypothetical protein